jgi:hypothetical protein
MSAKEQEMQLMNISKDEIAGREVATINNR